MSAASNQIDTKISVVIQCLNSDRHLYGAINSVLWQTSTDWELLLVDGGSTDGSVEIARSFAVRFPEKIRVLRHTGEKTLDIFSSRLWGAREARARILAHLDSDDEWHPRFLERRYEIYQKYFHSSPGMVYGPMVYWYEDPEQAAESFVQPMPMSGLCNPPALVIHMLTDGYAKSPGNSSVMINRDVLLEAAGLAPIAEGKITEDQFLWSFVALRYPIFIHPEPLVRYRQWSGSTCAKVTAAGLHHEQREKHLRWLLEHVEIHYYGIEKPQLLRAISDELTGLA
jgi:glycosyltransferase involved in cell wall biosynthesis